MSKAKHGLTALQYAAYTYPQLHGEQPIIVQVLETHQAECLVRLCSDMRVKGFKTVKAGRLHLCGYAFLKPIESPPSNADHKP
jgi:hypothetical protein